MIFKLNGDLILEPADKITIWSLDTAFDHDWIKLISFILMKRPEDESGGAGWSEDLVRTLALYGFEMFNKEVVDENFQIQLESEEEIEKLKSRFRKKYPNYEEEIRRGIAEGIEKIVKESSDKE